MKVAPIALTGVRLVAYAGAQTKMYQTRTEQKRLKTKINLVYLHYLKTLCFLLHQVPNILLQLLLMLQ